MAFERQTCLPRPNWQEKVSELGMFYHTVDEKVYWNESACYALDSKLVDKIEDATNELHAMCMDYVTEVVQKGNYEGYNFSDEAKFLIEKSWENAHQSIYGRFDLGIDSRGNLKMFEYNADTPTGLLEASVIQWNWKEKRRPEADQFNSIHEALVSRWTLLKGHYQNGTRFYFTTLTNGPHEDWGNVHYLLETACEAGIQASSIDLECIGWNGNQFVDMNNYPISHLFKLYPWEWMINDEFSNNIRKSNTVFYEPAWKMLLSNKLLLVKLWERHKNHSLLLESYKAPQALLPMNKNFITKPLLGREGDGVYDYDRTGKVITGHISGNVIQEKFNVVSFDGIQPVIGSWVIGDKAAGIGIREDKGITTNNSQFVPHYLI